MFTVAQGVHLGDNEILQLFKHADYDHSGAINWQEFVQSFQGGGGRRFIPEFLKPKSMRCSMLGAPWEWRAEPLDGLREAPRAKLFKVTSKPASSRRRLGLTDKR